jgi:hypothetical protein
MLNPFFFNLADERCFVAREIRHHLAYYSSKKEKHENDEEYDNNKPDYGHHISSFMHNPFSGDKPI